jgi:hypothetical protein
MLRVSYQVRTEYVTGRIIHKIFMLQKDKRGFPNRIYKA